MVSFWERPPAWYSGMLGGICLAGGVWSAVVGSWVRAGFCFLTALLCAHGAWRARRVGDEPLTVQRARMSARSLRIRAAIIVVVFTLLAVASTVFLVRADGNVTAYVVGGLILALSLYVAVAVLVRWRKVTRPSQAVGTRSGACLPLVVEDTAVAPDDRPRVVSRSEPALRDHPFSESHRPDGSMRGGRAAAR